MMTAPKTLHDKLIAFLLDTGYVEEDCKSRKYCMFSKPGRNYLFVGTHGALRANNIACVTGSIAYEPKSLLRKSFIAWCKEKGL